MKKIWSIFALSFTSLLLVSCNFSLSDGGDNDDDEPIVPELVSSEAYKQFWNPETELTFNITMSSTAAEFMNTYQTGGDSSYFDYFVPCTLTYSINGVETTYDEVGIRVKGNLSRNVFLDNGQFSLNQLAHFKLKFNETFDGDEYENIPALTSFYKTWNATARAERKERTLFDMEKVDLKWNRNDDESKVKQSYMLKTFRDNGVIAGHTTLANTTLSTAGSASINATYEILEVIDSVLMKRNFDVAHADGDLYKCAYQNAPANFSPSYTVGHQIGIEDNTANYHPAYDLKTNKTKSSSHTNLLNLFQAINDMTSSAATFKTKIEKKIEMKSFMMYEAIAFICGNFDDFRNNANNYYLYISSGDNLAYFIPYDFDRGLGAGCEGRQNYMTTFSAESTKMQCSGNWQTCNLFWRTICTSTSSSSGHADVARVEEYRATYQSNIESLLNEGKISNTSFTNYVDSFPDSYQGNAAGAGYNNISFSEYLSHKIAAIKENNTSYNITVSWIKKT